MSQWSNNIEFQASLATRKKMSSFEKFIFTILIQFFLVLHNSNKNFFCIHLHYLGECSTLTLTSSSSVSTFKTEWREKCVGEEGGDRFNVDGNSVGSFDDENLFDSFDDVNLFDSIDDENLFDSFDNVNLFDNASVDGIWVDKTVGGDMENPLENVDAANDGGDELLSRDVKMELPFKVFSMFDDIWSTFVDIWSTFIDDNWSTFIDDNWSTFDETILQGRCMLCCWLAAAACATAACR